jgi:predicted CopG family antitoxin
MTTKNLAIREKVYQKLAEAKRQGESFSDVIDRMLEKRGSLLPLWGALKDSDSIAEVEAEIRKTRKRATVRT